MTTAIEPSADEIELKPCPFCGGNPTLKYSPGFGWEQPPNKTMAMISCAACHLAMDYAATGKAIAAWNTRAAILAMDRRAEVVGEMDIEATAENIARHVGMSGKTGRIHQLAYEPAKAAALMALRLASPPAPAVAVPEGWKIVSVKPSSEMLMAGHKDRHCPTGHIYAAMLAAAPEPPATRGDMAAFGASEVACYLYPDNDKERAAFIAGAAYDAEHQPTATRPEAEIRNERIEARRKRLIIDDEIEILRRLAEGDTIVFSQDGEICWFTKGDRAEVGNAILALRDKGFLSRQCDDEENYRGMSEYDTISEAGRAHLATAIRALKGEA